MVMVDKHSKTWDFIVVFFSEKKTRIYRAWRYFRVTSHFTHSPLRMAFKDT